MAIKTLSTPRLLDIFRQLDRLNVTARPFSKIATAYDQVCTELERRGIALATIVSV